MRGEERRGEREEKRRGKEKGEERIPVPGRATPC